MSHSGGDLDSIVHHCWGRVDIIGTVMVLVVLLGGITARGMHMRDILRKIVDIHRKQLMRHTTIIMADLRCINSSSNSNNNNNNKIKHGPALDTTIEQILRMMGIILHGTNITTTSQGEEVGVGALVRHHIIW